MPLIEVKRKSGRLYGFMLAEQKECFGIQNFLHVRDEKDINVGGGTFTSGAWRVRDLNTVLINTIELASLASNTITLPIGQYYVVASAPAYRVNCHQCRWASISGSSVMIYGTSSRSYSSGYDQGESFVSGVFSCSEATQLQLQHRCEDSVSTAGLGYYSVFPDAKSVYSDVKIWKVS